MNSCVRIASLMCTRRDRRDLLIGCTILLVNCVSTALADHTPPPSSVTIVGSLQSELGCPGDWQPDGACTHLAFDAEDDVWQAVFDVPAGDWEYKAALNDSWDENYGVNATRNGANIPLSLSAPTTVKFYYDHETHWITDNSNSIIATAPGSYQSEMGATGDWQPDFLGSWLQDPDGDGLYSFQAVLPGGDYETKAAINESWDQNYGLGGVPGGPNIPFTVPGPSSKMLFEFEGITNVLTVTLVPEPTTLSLLILGSLTVLRRRRR